MAKPRATANNRLTMDDWIQAGYAILAEEGIKALKIDGLCSRLGVTNGSFYWHFSDMPGVSRRADRGRAELRDDDRRHFGGLARLPPRERLSQMMTSLVSARHWTLERAMRESARTDDRRAVRPRGRPSRELAGALTLDMKVSRIAMV